MDEPVKHSEAREKILNHNSLAERVFFLCWQLPELSLGLALPRLLPSQRLEMPPADSSRRPSESLKQDFESGAVQFISFDVFALNIKEQFT